MVYAILLHVQIHPNPLMDHHTSDHKKKSYPMTHYSNICKTLGVSLKLLLFDHLDQYVASVSPAGNVGTT